MSDTVILLPGLMCDRTVWEPQIHALVPEYHCLVPDYDHADSIGDMAEHVLVTAPDTFALAGHSMGGRVAMEVVRRAPQRVTRLALLDTAAPPLADGEAGQAEIAKRYQLRDLARDEGMRVMGAQWLQGMLTPEHGKDPRLCGLILDMIESRPVAVFERQIKALINRPDARPVLQNLPCPTTFICGAEDQWSPLETHYDMARMAGNAPVVPIVNAGHMATLEQPEAVTKALSLWLKR